MQTNLKHLSTEEKEKSYENWDMSTLALFETQHRTMKKTATHDA